MQAFLLVYLQNPCESMFYIKKKTIGRTVSMFTGERTKIIIQKLQAQKIT